MEDLEASDSETVVLTIKEYISRVCKELNIVGLNGVNGNELELIALVRNCQFLYDKSQPDFKNADKKDEAWKAIAAVFGISVDDTLCKWRNMRDSYNRYKKNRMSSGDLDNRNYTFYPFFSDLQFLDPFIVPRRIVYRNKKETLGDALEESASNSENNDDLSSGDVSKTWRSKAEVISFIQSVKDRPVLYHKKFGSASYKKQKFNEWAQIAQIFNYSVKECFNRFRVMRDRYSRARRAVQRSGVSKYELYEYLVFLDEHVRMRQRWGASSVNLKRTRDQKICVLLDTANSTNNSLLDSSDFLQQISKNGEEITVQEVEFLNVNQISEDTSYSIDGPSTTHSQPENEVSDGKSGEEDDGYDNDDGGGGGDNNDDDEEIDKKPIAVSYPPPKSKTIVSAIAKSVESPAKSKRRTAVSAMDEDELFGHSVVAELKRITCPKKKMKMKADFYRILYENTNNSI